MLQYSDLNGCNIIACCLVKATNLYLQRCTLNSVHVAH